MIQAFQNITKLIVDLEMNDTTYFHKFKNSFKSFRR